MNEDVHRMNERMNEGVHRMNEWMNEDVRRMNERMNGDVDRMRCYQFYMFTAVGNENYRRKGGKSVSINK